ncbi:MAG: glycosyltransferase [Candidatus Cloacimonadaceae bacterium]
MKVVIFNSLYPNPAEPAKGTFIQKPLMHYPEDIELEVIAPVPFFLSWWRRSKHRVPFSRYESLGNRKVRVWHPRFPLFPRNILRPWVPFYEYLCVAPLLWFLHRLKRIDLLHANFCMPDGVACHLLSRRFNIPYIITEHQGALAEYLENKSLKKRMLPAYLKAHKVIAVSQRLKGILIGHNIPESQVQVIKNGIDGSLFFPGQHAPTISRFIFIGNLIYNKGVQVLFQALALLGDKDIKLSIVGDGKYRSKLESLAKDLGISKQISFLGEKTASEVAALLREHDALVHPSFIESFGIAVVEALATGLPVLATINGGSEHILTPECGILVPTQDVKALAAGIKELISRNWDHQFIRDYAVQNYTIRTTLKETIALYPVSARKVCHLSSVHPRTDVRVYHKQCVSLAKAGYETHLVLADGKGNEKKQGVCIHDLGKATNRLTRMLTIPLKLLIKALMLKADLYQIHDPELIPIAILLRAITGKPVIYDAHECYRELFLHKEYLKPWQGKLASIGIRYLEALATKSLSEIITAIEYVAGLIGGTFVLHNYPLLSEWQGLEPDPNRFQSRNICYIGAITKERAATRMIKAMEMVDATLHLAGVAEPPEYIEELRQMPGYNKVVEYGYVDRPKAAKILSQCALGLVFLDPNPSYINAYPTKIFEYMAAGIPSLATNSLANIQIIDSSGAGRYIDSSTPEAIAQGINELLSVPEELAAMGAKGKALVEKELSWEAEVPAFLELYQSLINKEQK